MEKIGEEAASDPKMQNLQKKQIMLDRQKLSVRVQAMQKNKPAPEQAQEELSIDQQMMIINNDGKQKRNHIRMEIIRRAIGSQEKQKPLPETLEQMLRR